MAFTTTNSLLLIVDLEASCSNDGTIPREEMEIIEIGAVLAAPASFQVFDEFQAFVRPVRHAALTPFCRELTGIEQTDVDMAELFPCVMARFAAWFAPHAELRFCSWGDYDRKQIAQDCRFHNVPNPMPVEHLNLKRLFQQSLGMRRATGMAEALQKVGLRLEGRHHRGIDDARNIARLLPFVFGPTYSTVARNQI